MTQPAAAVAVTARLVSNTFLSLTLLSLLFSSVAAAGVGCVVRWRGCGV